MDYYRVRSTGKRWLEFDRNMDDLQSPMEMMDMGIVIDVSQAPKNETSWMSDENLLTTGLDLFQIHAMMYPLYFNEDYCIGRMANSFDRLAETASRGSSVIDERFYIMWDVPDPVFYFSVLMSNGVILMLRKTMSCFLDASGGSLYSFERDDAEEKLHILDYSSGAQCILCSSKRSTCLCPKEVIESRSIARIPKPKKLLQDAYTIPRSWEYLRYLFTGATPRTFTISVDTETLRPMYSPEEQLYLPKDKFRFPMMLSASVNSPDLETMKMSHIRHLIRRTSNPLTVIKGLYGISPAQGYKQRPLKGREDLALKESPEVKEKPECHICHVQFGRKYELQRHLKAVHQSVKEHVCKVCGKTFAVKHYLISHMTFVHEKKRDAVCGICGSSFQTQTKLRRHHRSVHLNDKPFSCPICPLSYVHASDLRRHYFRCHPSPTSSDISQITGY